MMRKIILTQPSGIGDLIQIYTLLEYVGAKEDVSIDIIVKNRQLIPILKQSGCISRIFHIDEIQTLQLLTPNVYKKVKAISDFYDTAVTLFPGRGIYSALLMRMLHAEKRVSHLYRFKWLRNTSLFLSSGIRVEHKSLLDINIDIFVEAGLLTKEESGNISRSISWSFPVDEITTQMTELEKCISSELSIGIFPGGNALYKRWSNENWKKFFDWAQKEYVNSSFTIFLGPDERSIEHEFHAMENDRVSVIKDQSFESVMYLLGKMDVLIGNDGGLSHVYSLYNKPQITLFGATDHITSSPLNEKNVNVLPDVVKYSPVYTPYYAFLKPEQESMMHKISLEQVQNAFVQIMDNL